MYPQMLSAFIAAITCWFGAFMEADVAIEGVHNFTHHPDRTHPGAGFTVVFFSPSGLTKTLNLLGQFSMLVWNPGGYLYIY